jgi:DNA-binding transcriptional LysR family regulator
MGNRLLPYAKRIRDLIHEAQRAVKDEIAPGGELCIGSLETTAALRLPPVLADYTTRCPNVDLQIQGGATEPQIESVLARRLDGAFVAGPVSHPDLDALSVVEEELVLVTPPHIATREAVQDYFSANGSRKVIVFRAGCSYRQRTFTYLAEQGFVDMRRMEMGTLDGIIGCRHRRDLAPPGCRRRGRTRRTRLRPSAARRSIESRHGFHPPQGRLPFLSNAYLHRMRHGRRFGCPDRARGLSASERHRRGGCERGAPCDLKRDCFGFGSLGGSPERF